MVLRGDMLLLAALALLGLTLGRNGGSMGASLHSPHTAGASSLRDLPGLRTLRDVLPDDGALCVLDAEEQLLCSEHGRFNVNTFGLRFGKRQGSSERGPSRRHSGGRYLLPVHGPRLLPT